MTIRTLSLVKFNPLLEGERANYPFANDLPLIFLGEISNMREHGVFAGYKSGRIYFGFHIANFVELDEDET